MYNCDSDEIDIITMYYVFVLLLQIESVKTIDDLQSVVLDNFDLMSQSGFTKPTSRLKMEDRVNIVQSVGLHSVILQSMAELFQFRDGLETLKVATAMKNHADLLHDFFVNNPPSVDSKINLAKNIGSLSSEHTLRGFMWEYCELSLLC